MISEQITFGGVVNVILAGNGINVVSWLGYGAPDMPFTQYWLKAAIDDVGIQVGEMLIVEIMRKGR